jgi:hypothetical protein
MKKTLLIFANMLFCAITFAQSVPQGINYQAVARDANGVELSNQALTIQLSVIEGSSPGNLSWQETHAVTTNNFGLFTAIIGQGASTGLGSSATFDVVDWGSDNHYIKVEMDGIDMGTTQLLSVPYALQAGNPGPAGADGTNGSDGVNGVDGVDGTNGSDGVNGVDGAPGVDGTNGFDGINGVDGVDGIDGADGTGADSLWADNGYALTPSLNASQNLNLNGDAEFNGFMTRIQGAIFEVWSHSEFYSDADFNGFMTRIQGAIFEVWSNSEFYGPASFHGDVRRFSPEINPEDLTSKAYVDGADAAIMDSVNALDSTMIANALWQDNGGYISPANYNDVVIDNNLMVIDDAEFNGFMTRIQGAIFEVWSSSDFLSQANFHSDADFNGFMTRIQGAIFEVWSNSEFYGPASFHGDVRRFSPEINPEDLTSKAYVDAAIAAIGAGNNGCTVSQLDCQATLTCPDGTSVSWELLGCSLGCMDPAANNYDPAVTIDDGSCDYTSLSIGDTYQGGIIFYLNFGGGGLIAAPSDQSNVGAPWGCEGTLIGTTASGIGDGSQNTVDILSLCTQPLTAASICADLTLGGYSDWFLPSTDELNKMWLKIGQASAIGNVGEFVYGIYWSSTEDDSLKGNWQDFTDGNVDNEEKSIAHYVRAIRAF